MRPNKKVYANLIAYPLAALVISRFVNIYYHIGRLVVLVELLVYSIVSLFAVKYFKMNYRETVSVVLVVAALYMFFSQSLFVMAGNSISIAIISSNIIGSVITSVVVVFVTKKYMKR